MTTQRNKSIQLNWSDGFTPPWHLRNGHVQTVLNSVGPRRVRARRVLERLSSEVLTLQAEDGTRLVAELDRAGPATSSIVILIHGWEGCSRSAYILTTAARLLEHGHDVLRLNLRDHGDTYHLNPELFNSTRSPEVASALQGFVDTNPYARVCLGGFSLGASFALRIAADNGERLGLDRVFAVCPPVDPANAMDALNSGPFIYEQYFFKRWRNSLQRKLHCFPELDYADDLARAKSLDDLNEMFIPRFTIYPTVQDYFAAYAVVGDRLASLRVPTWLIATEDDPIIPVGDLARIDPIDDLCIEVSRFGGHCGFIENLAARSWIEQGIQQFASSPG